MSALSLETPRESDKTNAVCEGGESWLRESDPGSVQYLTRLTVGGRDRAQVLHPTEIRRHYRQPHCTDNHSVSLSLFTA